MAELEPCPFCGGNAKISWRDMRFFEQNYFGAKKIKFASYGMCNRCKAKGPTVTAIIVTDVRDSHENFQNLFARAAEAWNRRAGNG